MACLKTNENIKTYQDVNNLITGIIFRMPDKYRAGKIVSLVERHMKGSEVKISHYRLTKMVEDMLDLFQREDLVTCNNGVYQSDKSAKVLSHFGVQNAEENGIN